MISRDLFSTRSVLILDHMIFSISLDLLLYSFPVDSGMISVFVFDALDIMTHGFVGFLRTYKSYGHNLGNYLANTFHTLFKMLMDINLRKRLLELAGVSENEFKKFDPLRAWIEVSLKYLAEVDKGALRLLDMAIIKLSGKGPNGCVELSEKEVAKLININVKDLWALVEKLEKFYLLFRDKYYYSNKISVYLTLLSC
jgi:hypothetical protein